MAKKKPKRQPSARDRRRFTLSRLWRRLRLPLLLIGLALLPRLVVLFQLTDSPVFYHPVIDADTYHERAIEIAAGDLAGYTSFWQAPLYSYFLGLLYWLLGVKILLAKLVQVLLGAVCCFLVFRLAARLFDRMVAWLSYVMLALCGPLIFFETQLLAPVLLNLLILLALLILMEFSRRPRGRILLLAGLLLGLAQITHGLVVAFLPLLFAWLFWLARQTAKPSYSGLRASLLVLLGFLPVIAVTTVHNLAVDGEPVLVSTNFGANFYLGNHPNYDSTTAIRPGLEWDEFVQEAAVQGHLTPSASSGYFAGKAWRNITGDLVGYAALLGKKLHLLLAGEEIKRNLDIYHFRSYSSVLRLLLWKRQLAFPSGLIIPAALVWLGCFFFFRGKRERRREKWLLVLFALSQVTAILLFFVATRYRLIIAPVAVIFAAALLWRWIESIRAGRWSFVLPTAVAFLILAVYSNLPRVDASPRDEAENHFYEGLAYSKAGDHERATWQYRLAVTGQPNYAMAEYNLALALDRAGDRAQADGLLAEIVRKNPASFMAHLVTGRARMEWSEMAAAEGLLLRTLEINPNSVEAHVNLGHLFRVWRDTVHALQHLRQALELNPKSFKALNQLGALYMEQGQVRLAEQHFRAAVKFNGSYVSALNNLATVVGQQGKVEEAAGYLERAYKLEPTDVSVALNLAMMRVRQSRPRDALRLAEEVAALAPRMPQAHFVQGMALLSLRRTREAKAAFSEALRLDPNYQPAREQLQRLGG